MTNTRRKVSSLGALRFLCSFAALSLPLGTLSCTDSDHADNTNTIAIGLLLPFTGASSGTSANFERAAIHATNRINAAGGVRGKRLRLVSADTHSSIARSAESAKRLMDEGAVVVIGAESSDIAAALEPTLVQGDVAFLSPLVGAADDGLVKCEDRWFRLAPSARVLGEALAKRLSADVARSVAILSETDAYSRAFGGAVNNRFRSLGGEVALQMELDSTAQSYDSLVTQVLATGVSNVVLATSPRTAALIINEFDSATRRLPKWYLSPLLKTDLLIQNVSPSALEGARGIAPRIYEQEARFRLAFQRRWEGDLPLEGAYFYYDAVALVAYALQVTTPNEAGVIAPATFKQSILDIATTKGRTTGWDDIEDALARLRAGEQVYYSGLTGPMVFNTCGVRMIGTHTTWGVAAGRIVDDNAAE